MSLEADVCLLCISKYNTILRKFGYKEMLLCLKLSGISQALSSVLCFLFLFFGFFVFFKRKCMITRKIFYFFIFYHSTYMMAQDMPGKFCFENLFIFLLQPQLAKAPNSFVPSFFSSSFFFVK